MRFWEVNFAFCVFWLGKLVATVALMLIITRWFEAVKGQGWLVGGPLARVAGNRGKATLFSYVLNYAFMDHISYVSWPVQALVQKDVCRWVAVHWLAWGALVLTAGPKTVPTTGPKDIVMGKSWAQLN